MVCPMTYNAANRPLCFLLMCVFYFVNSHASTGVAL